MQILTQALKKSYVNGTVEGFVAQVDTARAGTKYSSPESCIPSRSP